MRGVFLIGLVACSRTEAAVPKREHVLAGKVHVSPSLQGAVSTTDQVLIVAKRQPGMPPLAMMKMAVADFPLAFELRSPELEGDVELMVRIDKDGDPYTRRAGDLVGRLSAVRVGNEQVDVTVTEVLR